MTISRIWTVIISSLILAAVHTTAYASPAPWRQPLYLSGGGYWPERAPVHITNTAAVAAAGEPLEVAVPSLTGASIQSLRVCNEGGQELLWNVLDAAGSPKQTGKMLPTDRLVVPVECGPQSSTTEYAYVGNEQALAVPDFLQPGLINGQFEAGTGSPEGWKPSETDAAHVVTWEATGGHGGGRCLSTRVDAGAPATWAKWSQSSIPIVTGRTYRLSGWVRAQNVTGSAGWFIHVNGDKG
nr:hypothetical protein [Armatimonadota bacterium]